MTELLSVMDVTSESRLNAGYSKAVMPGNGSAFEHSLDPANVVSYFTRRDLLIKTCFSREPY